MKISLNKHAGMVGRLAILSIIVIMLGRLNAYAKDLEAIREWKQFVKVGGMLEYPMDKNINLEKGCLQAWVTIAFDPQMEVDMVLPKYNRPFWFIEFEGGNFIQCYWNIEDRAIRALTKNGNLSQQNGIPWIISEIKAKMKQGDESVITLSWGDEIALFIDGAKYGVVADKKYKTLWSGLDEGISTKEAYLHFFGPFDLDAIRIMDIPFNPDKADALTPTANSATLLLDTFSRWRSDCETQPERISSGTGGMLQNGDNKAKGRFGKRIHFNSGGL